MEDKKLNEQESHTDFRNVYIQERNSSDEKYIPPFDLAGV